MKKPKTALNAPKIDDRVPNPNSLQAKRDDRKKRHLKQSEGYSGRNVGGCFVTLEKDRVSLLSQSGIKSVRYDVSDEEWERVTGWVT